MEFTIEPPLPSSPSPENAQTLFPKINGKHAQFIRTLEHHLYIDPALKNTTSIHLLGTVKLHGAHADIVIQHPSNTIAFQSRNLTKLTPELDNHGFARAMVPLRKNILKLKDACVERWKVENPDCDVSEVTLAGEWIGSGIQKNVAVAEIKAKMFVICLVGINRVWQDTEAYADIDDERVGIVNVFRGGVFRAVLDVSDLKSSLGKLQGVADEVERECPFARVVCGVVGRGEGVVWRPCGEEEFLARDPAMWIKTKEPISSGRPVGFGKSLKVKEGREKAKGFAESVANEMRLEQGWDYLREMRIERCRKNVTEFLKWLWGDVEIEEKGDIKDAEIDEGLLKKEIEVIGREWYLEKVEKEPIQTF